MFAGLTTC